MAAVLAARKNRVADEDSPVQDVLAQELSYFVTKGEEERRTLKEAKIADREMRLDELIPYRKEMRELYTTDQVQVFIAGLIMLNFIAEALKAQLLPDKMSDSAAQLARFIDSVLKHLWDIIGAAFFVFGIRFHDTIWGGAFLEYVRDIFLDILVWTWVGVGRLFKRIPSLRRIIEGVLLAIPALAQVFCVLFILMGIWSVIGVEFFRSVAPREFGDFGRAMYTMFVVMMLEFPDISDPIIFDHEMPLAVVFFVSYVFVAGIVMTNVVVAVLIDKYLEHHEDPESEQKAKSIDELTFPTLYINRDGIMQPLRSITYSQFEKLQNLLDTFEPPKIAMADDHISGFSNVPLKKWSSRRVQGWLEAIDFKKYQTNFAKENITGEVLSTITEFDLHSLGMRIGDRKKFNQHLHTLYSEQRIREKKRKDMRQTFNQYDSDGSGNLDLEEFIQAWFGHTKRQYSNRMNSGFKRTLSVLQKEKENEKNLQRRQDAERIFRELDADGSGEIDFEEFCQAFENFGAPNENTLPVPGNSSRTSLVDSSRTMIQDTICAADVELAEINTETPIRLKELAETTVPNDPGNYLTPNSDLQPTYTDTEERRTPEKALSKMWMLEKKSDNETEAKSDTDNEMKSDTEFEHRSDTDSDTLWGSKAPENLERVGHSAFEG